MNLGKIRIRKGNEPPPVKNPNAIVNTGPPLPGSKTQLGKSVLKNKKGQKRDSKTHIDDLRSETVSNYYKTQGDAFKKRLDALRQKTVEIVNGQPLVQNLGGGIGHREQAPSTERTPPSVSASSNIPTESCGSITDPSTVNLAVDENEENIDKTNQNNALVEATDMVIQYEKHQETQSLAELAQDGNPFVQKAQDDTVMTDAQANIVKNLEEEKNNFNTLISIQNQNLSPEETKQAIQDANIIDPKHKLEYRRYESEMDRAEKALNQLKNKLDKQVAQRDYRQNDNASKEVIDLLNKNIEDTENAIQKQKATLEKTQTKLTKLLEKNAITISEGDVNTLVKSSSTVLKNTLGLKTETVSALFSGLKASYNILVRKADQTKNLKALVDGLGPTAYSLIGKAKELYDKSVGALIAKVWKSKEDPAVLNEYMDIDQDNKLSADANNPDQEKAPNEPPAPPRLGKDAQSQGYLEYFANEFMDILNSGASQAPPEVINQIITEVIKPTPQWNDNVFQYMFGIDEQKEIVEVTKTLLDDKVIEHLNAQVANQVKELMGNRVESSYAIERYVAMIMNMLIDNKIKGLTLNDVPNYLKDLKLNNSTLPNIWGLENLENRPSKFAEGNDYIKSLEDTIKAFEEIINEKKKTDGEPGKRRGRKPKIPKIG